MKKQFTRQTINETICRIISEILEEEIPSRDESAKLVNDIGLDSMGFLELAVQIQREFDVIIKNEEWESIKTLSNVFDVIQRKLEENGIK